MGDLAATYLDTLGGVTTQHSYTSTNSNRNGDTQRTTPLPEPTLNAFEYSSRTAVLSDWINYDLPKGSYNTVQISTNGDSTAASFSYVNSYGSIHTITVSTEGLLTDITTCNPADLFCEDTSQDIQIDPIAARVLVSAFDNNLTLSEREADEAATLQAQIMEAEASDRQRTQEQEALGCI